MQWDLGLQGLSALAALSLGFGVLAGLLVGGGWSRRLWTVVVTTCTCLVAGLLTSEWLFGWATEEELQPNIDGLSRDEVLLAGVLTTGLVVWLVRHRARAARRTREPHAAGHA
jgi:hypothetical protein